MVEGCMQEGGEMKMRKISAQKLNNKRVVDLEGGEIGMLHSVIADVGSGYLTELLVKPAPELDTSAYRVENGFLFVPFHAVKAIKDVIVVDSEMILRA
jgi:sporulation protein YlmC with PRC-barrel domain